MTWIYVAILIVTAIFTIVAWTTLTWMLYAWRTADELEDTRFAEDAPPAHKFSLIVPARHEEQVLGTTLARLAELRHPDYEVVVVVGHDDPGTAQIAQRAAALNPDLMRVVVDHNEDKNKPKALNTGLPHCTGDYIAVFDAEDLVHIDLLRRVDATIQKSDPDIVQSGVQLMSFKSNWFSVRNVLEYYFWFRSRLHFHADQGFIPLGGNTVFIRRSFLEAAGGWDPNALAEDCELGSRLSTKGAKTIVAYEPELVTQEETPRSLGAFFKQRTRWTQGFLQVLMKGEWRRLKRGQKLLAIYTLANPFLQAIAGLMIPVAIAAMIWLDAPIIVSLLTFTPLLPTIAILAVEIAGLGAFCRDYGKKAGIVDYLRLILGTIPYQFILGIAALRAVWRQIVGHRGWEKTPHVGAHFST